MSTPETTRMRRPSRGPTITQAVTVIIKESPPSSPSTSCF